MASPDRPASAFGGRFRNPLSRLLSRRTTRRPTDRTGDRTNGRATGQAGLAVASVAALAVLATGCGSGGDSAAKPAGAAAEKPLTIYNSYSIAGLDPVGTGTNWLFDWGVAENLMEAGEDGVVRPWLAQSVTQGSPTEWRITLRPGMTFQNGRPVDAEAVNRALTRQIARSKAVRTYLAEGSTVRTTGPLDLVLTTPAPNAAVPAALAARDTSLQIYDTEAVEAAGGYSAKIVNAGAFTGPYAVTAWTPDLLKLARYDKYWAGRPKLPSVTVKVVPDEQARIAGVQSGEAQLAFYPSPDAALTLAGRTDSVLRTSPKALQALLIDMNLTAAPFDDARVRRAFARAIDYRELGEDVAKGSFATATGLYPEGYPYAAATQHTDFAEANRLLDEAGWAKGKDGVRGKDGKRLTVRFVTQAQGPETNALAVVIKSEVAKAGFDLQIVNAEDSARTKADLGAWEASIGLNGSLSGTADPIQPFRARWTTGGSANAQKLSDPRVDALGDRLLTTTDQAAREQLLREGQAILSDREAYVIAATYKQFAVVAGGDWTGYQVSNVRRHLRFDTAP
ncbi:ABC transporter substrate-binding protein [Streptodolium elevatio]|uniref:ABC transporter substrate-binding protein n=1 Tax=Streptodolium elevatio TaxID=3157996 RepID=A0ABV3DCF8_9ACTN